MLGPGVLGGNLNRACAMRNAMVSPSSLTAGSRGKTLRCLSCCCLCTLPSEPDPAGRLQRRRKRGPVGGRDIAGSFSTGLTEKTTVQELARKTGLASTFPYSYK